ncbi:MAG: 30S ribosomal protein S6 [Clostridiales Family XIII bacterium]|jgi:small subunit ribosomal protein S6|nr:30S ribosomal protein S6 [Clostridiales Family XIII bacterium]
MTHYEIMFILAAALEKEQKDAMVQTVQEIIANGGGTVTKTDIPGTKKLAYPIQKKNEGYYVIMEFEAPPDLPKELDRRLRISDNAIRHLIVNKDEK